MNVESLCRQNILKIKPYVPGKPIEEVQRELGLSEVIKLASNENPLGPSPKAVEALKENLVKLNLYPDGYCYELRRKVSGKYEVKPSSLIFGNGADELIKLIAEAFVNPGDEVIIGDMTFSEYEFGTRLLDGVPVIVPLKDFRFDLEAILQAITARTKLIFICNPNNPTGTFVTKTEVEAFLTKVPENVLVIFDEAYHEYVEDENYPQTLSLLKQGQKNIIILRTFSKIYGLAGLRIGYAFSSPEIISLIERTREPFNVNLAAQIAAAAALDDEEHLQKSREVNRIGKEILEEGFKALGFSYIPTQANFIFVDTKMNSRLLFEALLRLGIIVRTGDIFGKENFLRVSIGTSGENKRFLEALAAVLKKEEEQNLSRK